MHVNSGLRGLLESDKGGGLADVDVDHKVVPNVPQKLKRGSQHEVASGNLRIRCYCGNFRQLS